VIETRLSRTRPSSLNLYLGDQLEFRCLSRESKPNTQLDWIINEKLNLTATPSPVGPNGLPLFRVTNHRFIRLPRSVNSRKRSDPEADHKSNQNSLTKAVIQFHSKQPQPPQTINEVIYELADANSQQQAGQRLSESAQLGLETLDQFLESSVTLLNFTVDTNLAQYLQAAYGSRETSTLRSHQRWTFAQRNTANDSTAPANRSPAGTNFRTKKVNADQRRSNSNGQPDGEVAKLPLDIRCSARVLHLTMSDEIRLKVLNRSRSEVARGMSASIEAQRQEKRVTQSSSDGKYLHAEANN
jgi:hypothetical protein